MLVHTTDSLVETLYSEKLAHKLKQSTSYCYERTQWPMPRISEVRKVWNSVKAWKVCVCKHTLDTAGRFVHRRARTKEDKSFCWSCCSFFGKQSKDQHVQSITPRHMGLRPFCVLSFSSFYSLLFDLQSHWAADHVYGRSVANRGALVIIVKSAASGFGEEDRPKRDYRRETAEEDPPD